MKTPLYEIHKNNNAFIQNYYNFQMPIYYTSIYDEHLIVRNSAGVFDISHMGNIILSGKDLYPFLYSLIPNQLRKNKITYSLFLNEEGKIIDDFMIYPLTTDKVMLVVNASNTKNCMEWLLKHQDNYDINIENKSETIAAIALQGPKSKLLLEKIINNLPEKLHDYQIDFDNNTIISRSGYTKELGYEIYGSSEFIINLTNKLLALSAKLCGLGSRDTLRFEAGLGLYGNELSLLTTPYEADLSFLIENSINNYVGKAFLSKYEPTKSLVRLKLETKQAARTDYPVLDENQNLIGKITSGYLLPNYNYSHAFALIDKKEAFIDNIVYIDIRGKLREAKVINKNIMKKEIV